MTIKEQHRTAQKSGGSINCDTEVSLIHDIELGRDSELIQGSDTDVFAS